MDRDTDALKAALEHHSVKGYDVVVPFFNEATIIEQGATGPVRHVSPEAVKLGSPMVFYKIRAKNPIPFMTWATMRFGRSAHGAGRGYGGEMNIRYDLESWRQTFPQMLKTVPDYLMKKLEEGGQLSWIDVEHDSLVQRGCIDQNDNVSCYTFWSSEVHIDPRQLKRGQLVEYEYGRSEEKTLYQGRIVGFTGFPGTAHSKQKDVALLELFTPLPYLECPDSIASSLIRKGFYSEGTYALGYGSYEALEIAQEESGQKLIPEGKWDSERRIYTLKEFLPLKMIEDLCREAYGEEPHCTWQSMIMYIVPIMLFDNEYKGIWHPLPEHAVESEYVVSYDFEE